MEGGKNGLGIGRGGGGTGHPPGSARIEKAVQQIKGRGCEATSTLRLRFGMGNGTEELVPA
jgi:hypothetical protein